MTNEAILHAGEKKVPSLLRVPVWIHHVGVWGSSLLLGEISTHSVVCKCFVCTGVSGVELFLLASPGFFMYSA